MKPLPSLPDRDDSDRTGENAIWALIFLGLGTFILANASVGENWPWIILGAVAYCASAYFLYLLIVRRR